MCLSISGSCLNAPRITGVRTISCGEYPGTLVALFRIEINRSNRDKNKAQSVAQRAGPLVRICDDFL